jgi:hypothetical protein
MMNSVAWPEGSEEGMVSKEFNVNNVNVLTNYQREAIESLEHDGVLSAQIVRRQSIGLPFDSLVRVGQELCPSKVRAIRDVGRVEMLLPS